MIIDRDELYEEKKEATEWETNAINRAIQHLIKNTLNNDVYRKVSRDSAVEAVRTVFREYGVLTEAKYIRSANRLLHKVEKAKTTQEVVILLGEFLLT